MKSIENLINIGETRDLLKFAKENQEVILKGVNGELTKNNIIYKNDLYPLCVNPIILNDCTLANLNNLSKEFNALIKDSISLFKRDNELFEWVLGDHPLYGLLKNSLQSIGKEEMDNLFYRLDGILEDNQIKIIEANTNSPGGLFTLEKMHEINSSIYSQLGYKNLNFLKGSDSLLEHFIKNYQKRFSNGELFAVVGDKHDEERFEHRLIAKKLRENNIPARTFDTHDRNIKLNGESLFYGDKKIGILYRRSFPLHINPDIVYSERFGKTQVLNPPFSKLLGSKSMLAFFHKFKDSYLSSYKDFIENNIVYTTFFSELNPKNIITDKNSYVIKEISLNCGKGIYIGKAESSENWEQIVNNSNPKNVVQKYHEQPSMNFLDNKVVGEKLRRFDFNTYSIGDQTIMPYMRVNAEGNYKSNNACGSSESTCFFGGKK